MERSDKVVEVELALTSRIYVDGQPYGDRMILKTVRFPTVVRDDRWQVTAEQVGHAVVDLIIGSDYTVVFQEESDEASAS